MRPARVTLTLTDGWSPGTSPDDRADHPPEHISLLRRVDTAAFSGCDSNRSGPYAVYDISAGAAAENTHVRWQHRHVAADGTCKRCQQLGGDTTSAFAAAGRIVLEQCLVRGMQRLPVALSETTHAFAESLFSQISRFVKAQACAPDIVVLIVHLHQCRWMSTVIPNTRHNLGCWTGTLLHCCAAGQQRHEPGLSRRRSGERRRSRRQRSYWCACHSSSNAGAQFLFDAFETAVFSSLPDNRVRCSVLAHPSLASSSMQIVTFGPRSRSVEAAAPELSPAVVPTGTLFNQTQKPSSFHIEYPMPSWAGRLYTMESLAERCAMPLQVISCRCGFASRAPRCSACWRRCSLMRRPAPLPMPPVSTTT